MRRQGAEHQDRATVLQMLEAHTSRPGSRCGAQAATAAANPMTEPWHSWLVTMATDHGDHRDLVVVAPTLPSAVNLASELLQCRKLVSCILEPEWND